MDPYVSVGLALAGIAEVMAILSTSLPYWYQISTEIDDNTTVHGNYGLFEACGTTEGVGNICMKYAGGLALGPDGVHSAPSWLKASQAMMILSVIGLAGGVVLAGMYIIKIRDWVSLIAASAALTLVGVLFGLAGTPVAGAKFTTIIPQDFLIVESGSLHAAFGLGVLTVITGAAAAIILGVAWRRHIF